MRFSNHKQSFGIIIVGIFSVLIFWQFFLKGLYPYPGNFLTAWYEPWKTDNSINGTILIQHKAVADDIFRQLYPLKVLAIEIIKKSEWPLWNPYNGAGMPLMATMHIGYLNPYNLFFFILPNADAWSIYVILQPLLIASFLFIYLRKIGLALNDSIFSSLVFSLSGFVTTRSIYGDYDYALAILPLLLYILECYLQNYKTKKIFLIPVLVAFLVFSVQPQIIIYILCFVFIYFLYRFFYIKKTKQISNLNIFLVLILLLTGAGISAIQIIPTLELINLSNINADSSKFIIDKFLLSPLHFITILIPNYFGNPGTYNYWGQSDYVETIASIGTIPVFFAFLGILGYKKKMNNIQINEIEQA